MDHYRRRSARPETLEAAAGSEEVATDEMEELVQRWLVQESLRRLGEDHRRALEETYLAERPYAEVAAELGIPQSTLRSRVFYGLKALRVIMDELEVTR